MFILYIFCSINVFAQDTGIYKIRILKKNWFINGYDIQYQGFQPEVINPNLSSDKLFHILYDTKSSGNNIPDVLRNIEKNNVDTEYNYVPMQARNAVTLAAAFKRNTNTFLLHNQELRIGIRFNANSIPAVVIKEKASYNYHQFHPIVKDLSLDFSYLLNTRALGRWALYMGVGASLGVSIENKYMCYVRSSNSRMNGAETDVLIKTSSPEKATILYGKSSIVTSTYGLVGFKYNLDCEFNLFSELTLGYIYRKYSEVNAIESIYLGATFGVRYKVTKDKLIYKKRENPFW